MVFQSYALYPHLSVYDNLAFGLRRMGADLEKTRLPDLDARPAETCRRQRLPCQPGIRTSADPKPLVGKAFGRHHPTIARRAALCF
jgi:ABC-type sugar transport system ATPase subunit